MTSPSWLSAFLLNMEKSSIYTQSFKASQIQLVFLPPGAQNNIPGFNWHMCVSTKPIWQDNSPKLTHPDPTIV